MISREKLLSRTVLGLKMCNYHLNVLLQLNVIVEKYLEENFVLMCFLNPFFYVIFYCSASNRTSFQLLLCSMFRILSSIISWYFFRLKFESVGVNTSKMGFNLWIIVGPLEAIARTKNYVSEHQRFIISCPRPFSD